MTNIDFTDKELAAIRSEHCKGATDNQFELFISECKARNLRPGVHLVFQLRNAKEYDPETGANIYVKKPYWITTIAALRLIAQRTGDYLGQGPEEYVYLDEANQPTVTSEIPLPSKTKNIPEEPWVARAKVYRKGFTEPMIGLARFEAYAGTTKRGDKVVLTDMWEKRGPEQLYKCAEALALRKAFPEELGSLYLSEEIRTEEEDKPQGIAPASVAPSAPVVPKVDQTPATPTDAPRPNESFREEIRNARTSEDYQKIGEKLEIKYDKPLVEPKKEPAKRGRKPKSSPVNGQDQGITDEDLAQIGTPAPVVEDQSADAAEFVEGTDPRPTPEEKKAFVDRVRELTKKGTKGDDIKARILALASVEKTDDAPKRFWEQALSEFEKPETKQQ